MIRNLKLKNFKCFQNFNMDCTNVNVFTGINGMGKSTVLQSLLLLKQSGTEEKKIKGLRLNDRYVSLGNAQDVLYDEAEDDVLEMEYTLSDGTQKKYAFQYIQDSDILPICASDKVCQTDGLFEGCVTYLSANRIIPQKAYNVLNEDEVSRKEFGNNGEYAIQYLGTNLNKEVKNSKLYVSEKQNSLLSVTKYWMDRIAPGVSPQITVDMASRTSTIQYDFVEGIQKTNSYKSVNVGFGITYVLPVIVALISANEGDIVLIENPEAHIHPMGQRMLGELITLAGLSGAQIFIETHSDHIINGIRVAVKQKKISPEQVNLAYFYKDDTEEFKHKYVSLEMDEEGRIDIWPEGFLDEWGKALYELM